MPSPAETPSFPRRRLLLAAGSLLLGGGLIATLLITQSVDEADRGPKSAPVQTSLGAEDGFLDPGASLSPFADDVPAIARLSPELREAMQAAATAARADGYEFVVTSGWRSERYQQSLFDDAVQRYGSVGEASRWVAAIGTSAHVTGDAVDIGFTDANSWLSQHGADYGLCQTFANEMWHFELATERGGECPAQLTDPS